MMRAASGESFLQITLHAERPVVRATSSRRPARQEMIRRGNRAQR